MTRTGALAALCVMLVGATARADEGPGPLVWKPATQSPRPATAAGAVASLAAACGPADVSLVEVAARNLSRQLAGKPLFASDELAFELRAAGDPHVWPRAWSISGPPIAEDDLEKRLSTWLGGWKTQGVRRCGLARGKAADGTAIVSAIAFDALADMAPLPTTARVGQWLTLEGTMLVRATDVSVVLLGPRGAPKTIVGSLSGSKIRSTFAVDQPGPWLVQVLATVSTGPRPVLEAMVYAGATPPDRFVRAPAPGEDAGKNARDDADAMSRMVNAARAAEGLPPLARDADLDRLARLHSDEMAKAKMIGHDVGGGDPKSRLVAAGIKARIAGENVASSTTVEGAHRALWASPSHRDNILLTRFSRIGVAVVRGDNGTVWVTELFAG